MAEGGLGVGLLVWSSKSEDMVSIVFWVGLVKRGLMHIDGIAVLNSVVVVCVVDDACYDLKATMWRKILISEESILCADGLSL
jgi:hypothetical protein